MLEKFAANDKYLTGDYLVGDDFNLDEINIWYKEEEEAYYNLSGNEQKNYLYENLNNFYGLTKKVKELKYKKDINILCFGAAYGGEVKSIMKILSNNKIKDFHITIIDPSTEMLEIAKKALSVNTIKANIDGKIDSLDNQYDLITCFGVLHHIPNVSFVLSELIRVLKQDGNLILREPVSSMGQWGTKRIGTTINERGLGIQYLTNLISNSNIKVVSSNYLLFSPLLQVFNKFNIGIDNRIVIFLDYMISKFFGWNITYNRKSLLKKFAPGSVFLIVKK